MKDLTNFLAGIAICVFLDYDYLAVVDAAGIHLEDLPPSDPVRFLKEFRTSVEKSGLELAKEENRDGLRLMQFHAPDPKDIPRDHKALAQKFKLLIDAYDYEKLGTDLAVNPAQGEKILENFMMRKSKYVDAEAADIFVPYKMQKFIELAHMGKSKVIIPGFEKLSDMIGGFNPGRLIMFLADTGYGKTQANLNFALNAARSMRVAYINQEMTYEDIALRIACIATTKTFNEMHKANFTMAEVEQALSNLNTRLVVTSGKELSIPQIKSWIKLRQKEGRLDFVIVDYDQRLQLFTDHRTPEWQAMKRAVEELEVMAREENLCVILLAQQNREGAISSSHRSTYAAHTVLYFFDHDDLGPVIQAKKNRHGKREALVRVNYRQESGNIFEADDPVMTPKSEKIERKDIYG